MTAVLVDDTPQHRALLFLLLSDSPRAQQSATHGRPVSDRLLVRGCRLGPQVEFGTIRLDFAPHGSQAEYQHGQDDQLLHCVASFTGSHHQPDSQA